MGLSPRLLRPKASGGFSPRSISGLALWLDSSDSSTLFQDSAGTVPATATSDPVGYWGDKSGSGRHATQTTAASRPTLATAAVNGRTAVAVDGAGKRIGNATNVPLSGGASLFIVVQRTANSDSGIHSFSSASAQTNHHPFGTDYYDSFASITRHQWSQPYRTDTHLYAVVAGTGWNAYINGANVRSVASHTLFQQTTSWGQWIGSNGSSSALGRYCEVLAYPSALSAPDRQRIERYLAAKWGITLAPVVTNADAQDWVNRVYSNGGTVSASTANAVNTFCNDIDAAGIRGRFYRLNLFCGTADASLIAVRTPLYRGPSLAGTQYGNTLDTNVNFAITDYAETGASGGLTGNGSSRYLQTGVRGDQLPAGFEADCHLSVYRRTAGNGQTLISSYYYNTVTTTDRHNYEITQDTNCILGRETGAFTPAGAAYPRFNIPTRSSSTSMFSYVNGVAGPEFTTATAGVATGVPFTVFCRNLVTGAPPAVGGYAPTFYSSSTLGSYSIGRSMSASQVTDYTNAINAFMSALGRNV
jgi:hypothetical protein